MVTHGDFVDKDLGATETTETNIGTITMSAKARRIVGIWGVVVVQTNTAGEGTHGQFRMESPDIDLAPSKFPCDMIMGSAGTVAGGASHHMTRIIPVDIPVSGLSKIDFHVATDLAQTGTCHATCGVIYE